MKTWTRAGMIRICGDCGELIHKGKPILEIVIDYRPPSLAASATTTRIVCIRCEACAGPAPPDLPQFIERAGPTFTPMAHILTGPGTLPLDFKARATGEREPGEEG